MNDINTVSLSGTLRTKVDISEYKGLNIARFFMDVEGAGDQKSSGNFKVVAFAELAEAAQNLTTGDRVVVVGALSARQARGKPEIEIRIRNLIKLPKKTEEEILPDFKVSEIE